MMMATKTPTMTIKVVVEIGWWDGHVDIGSSGVDSNSDDNSTGGNTDKDDRLWWQLRCTDLAFFFTQHTYVDMTHCKKSKTIYS